MPGFRSTLQTRRSASYLLYFAIIFAFLFSALIFRVGQIPLGLWLVCEDGFYEMLGAIACLLASGLFFETAWNGRGNAPRFGILWLLLLGAASFFLFAEEISWGQRLFGHRGPDWLIQSNYQGETTLHNMSWFRSEDGAKNYFDSLGHLALALLFVVLPASQWIPPVRRYLISQQIMTPSWTLVLAFVLTLTLQALLPAALAGLIPFTQLQRLFIITETSEALIQGLIFLFAWEARRTFRAKVVGDFRTVPRLLWWSAPVVLALLASMSPPPTPVGIAEGQVLAGQHWLAIGDVERAAKCFESGFNLDPQNVDALIGVGSVMIATNRIDDALAAYQRGIELDPFHPHVHLGLGICWQIKANPRTALEHYRRATELEPSNESSRMRLGMLLTSQRELEDAIEQFSLILERNPANVDARIGVSQALIADRKLEKARDHLTLALEQDSTNADALNYLGIIAASNESWDEAAQFFQQSLEHDRQHSEAQANLIELQRRVRTPE